MRKLLTMLAITAVFASCKKETVTNPVPQENKKVKQIIYTDNTGFSETETVGYDAKGRMLNYVEENRTYSFSYESDTKLVITTRKKSDNSLIGTNECTLNNKGVITEIINKDAAGVHIYTYQYTYDANNQMTGVKGFGTSGIGYELAATAVNGNITNIAHYSDGSPNGTSVYYYENAKSCKIPHTLGGNWPSAVLFGKSNTLLPTEFKRWNQAGTLIWHNKSANEFDAEGYVTKITTTYLDGTISVITYQYE
jgi:hypothetical protein